MDSPQIPIIDGCIPGHLDPSQPNRILRHPDSKLFFIPYDPLTASAHDNPTIECVTFQRIVVEVQPNGTTTWKFVPNAGRALNVKDEGVWPRVLNICGRLAYCTRDQWDIYKLDPAYTCYVNPESELTTVSKNAQDRSNTQSMDSGQFMVVDDPPIQLNPTVDNGGEVEPGTAEPRVAGKKRPASPTADARRDYATHTKNYMDPPKNPLPDAARQKLTSYKRRKKKEERLRRKFAVKVPDLADIEVPTVEVVSPESAHHMTKEGVDASLTKANENEQRTKIEEWEARRIRIESQYSHEKWTIATFLERFLELMTWYYDRPLGVTMDPTAIPWPVFKKPYLIEPEDIQTEEVEWFLLTLRNTTDSATFFRHLKNLRVRFHPDKWRGNSLNVEDGEEREKWERALVNTSQAISGLYDIHK